MNLVEVCFAISTRQAIRRGSFASVATSTTATRVVILRTTSVPYLRFVYGLP